MGMQRHQPPVVIHKAPHHVNTHVHPHPHSDEFIEVNTYDSVPHDANIHPHQAYHTHGHHVPEHNTGQLHPHDCYSDTHNAHGHANHTHEQHESLPPGVHVHHPPNHDVIHHHLAHHHYNHHNREVDEENIYYTEFPIPEVDHDRHPRKIYKNFE